MDDVRFGAGLRALRLKRGLRQADVAAAANVSQQTVSDLERGILDSLACVRAVCRALGASISLHLDWRGGEIDRFVDAAHARLVERTAMLLRTAGWTVALEFSFNHYGDRGSVDILAFHPVGGTLLIVEVKTSIRNVSELFRRLDVKQRVVPAQAAAANGWKVRHVATVLVVPGTSAMWRAVRSHRASFAASLPARTAELKQWLREPDRPIKGILFVRNTGAGGTGFRELAGSTVPKRSQTRREPDSGRLEVRQPGIASPARSRAPECAPRTDTTGKRH